MATDTTDDNIDQFDEDSADDAPAPEAAPAPAPAAAAADPAPTPLNPMVTQYLQNKQALAAAQSQASQNQLVASLARAAGGLGHSIARSNAPMDESGFNALDQQAQAPVQRELAREAQAKNDPNSPTAVALRQIYKPMFQKAGLDPSILDGMGADDIRTYAQNPLEATQKQKTLEATRLAQVQARADAASDRADSKTTADQAKAYTTMRKDLESFRGNQSAQQAGLAIQNSDKALALVQATPTSQNLNLLADEMGKIATGGVPGETGTRALLPDNLYTKVAEIKSWVTGHPNASAADVTEYLNNNRDYINQVRTVAQKTLHDYRTNIAKGYKGRVSANDYQEAVDDYGLGGARVPQSGSPSPAALPPVERQTKDGKVALFDPTTKKFLRYK